MHYDKYMLLYYVVVCNTFVLCIPCNVINYYDYHYLLRERHNNQQTCHNKSSTLKLLDKNIVRNNLLARSKVRPAKYGSSIAPNQSEVKTTILAVQHLGFVSVGSNSQS